MLKTKTRQQRGPVSFSDEVLATEITPRANIGLWLQNEVIKRAVAKSGSLDPDTLETMTDDELRLHLQTITKGKRLFTTFRDRFAGNPQRIKDLLSRVKPAYIEDCAAAIAAVAPTNALVHSDRWTKSSPSLDTMAPETTTPVLNKSEHKKKKKVKNAFGEVPDKGVTQQVFVTPKAVKTVAAATTTTMKPATNTAMKLRAKANKSEDDGTVVLQGTSTATTPKSMTNKKAPPAIDEGAVTTNLSSIKHPKPIENTILDDNDDDDDEDDGDADTNNISQRKRQKIDPEEVINYKSKGTDDTPAWKEKQTRGAASAIKKKEVLTGIEAALRDLQHTTIPPPDFAYEATGQADIESEGEGEEAMEHDDVLMSDNENDGEHHVYDPEHMTVTVTAWFELVGRIEVLERQLKSLRTRKLRRHY